MRTIAGVLAVALAGCAWGLSQDQPRAEEPQVQPQAQPEAKPKRGPGREIGSGAGDIGSGAARGAGNLAKGTGKGAVDLVTLHPLNAGAALGKGALDAGRDVTVGSVKGSAKVVHGVGRAIKRLF